MTLRRLGNRGVAPVVAAFVRYLTSPRAATLFREAGMLPARDAWPPVS